MLKRLIYQVIVYNYNPQNDIILKICLICLIAVQTKSEEIKNGAAPFIAPLQPSTLAAFPPWGSSRGAGRKRLTPAQI